MSDPLSNMSINFDSTSLHVSSPSTMEDAGPKTSNDVLQDRYIFRSTSHVYTEIRKEDLDEWAVIDNIDNPGTVFDFFEILHQQYNGRLEIGGSDRMRVLARELAPGVDSNVDVSEISYRKYLGDANFNHAKTPMQERNVSRKGNRSEKKNDEGNNKNDVFDDMDDFSLFSDLE